MAKKSDLWIHIMMLALMLFGFLMIGSASMGLGGDDSLYLVKTLVKQLVFLGVGYWMMAQLSQRFKLSFLKSKQFLPMIVMTVISLLACRFFISVNGAYAWIRIPIPGMQITIQPSEFAKIVAMLIVAAYLGDVKNTKDNPRKYLGVPAGIIFLFLVIIAIIQSDFGSAFVILLITCVCLLIPRNPYLKPIQKWLRILFYVAVGVLIFVATPQGLSLIQKLPFLKEYQKNRFAIAFNPFADRYGNGYQLVNGLIAFASGGWTGVGFGKSVMKYSRFPAANTDFILSIIGEELGYVGILILLALYSAIIFRLLYFALKMKSERARIMLVGCAMYFVFHIFFNIGGVTGMIPLTGIPLLLISSGGSSAMSIMACVGICQALISAYNRGEIQ